MAMQDIYGRGRGMRRPNPAPLKAANLKPKQKGHKFCPECGAKMQDGHCPKCDDNDGDEGHY